MSAHVWMLEYLLALSSIIIIGFHFTPKTALLMYSSTPWENVIENIFGLQERTFNCIIAKNSPLIVNKVL